MLDDTKQKMLPSSINATFLDVIVFSIVLRISLLLNNFTQFKSRIQNTIPTTSTCYKNPDTIQVNILLQVKRMKRSIRCPIQTIFPLHAVVLSFQKQSCIRLCKSIFCLWPHPIKGLLTNFKIMKTFSLSSLYVFFKTNFTQIHISWKILRLSRPLPRSNNMLWVFEISLLLKKHSFFSKFVLRLY